MLSEQRGEAGKDSPAYGCQLPSPLKSPMTNSDSPYRHYFQGESWALSNPQHHAQPSGELLKLRNPAQMWAEHRDGGPHICSPFTSATHLHPLFLHLLPWKVGRGEGRVISYLQKSRSLFPFKELISISQALLEQQKR